MEMPLGIYSKHGVSMRLRDICIRRISNVEEGGGNGWIQMGWIYYVKQKTRTRQYAKRMSYD
jgi:hypothetical protein